MTGEDLEYALRFNAEQVQRGEVEFDIFSPVISRYVKDAFTNTRGCVVAVATLGACHLIGRPMDALRTRDYDDVNARALVDFTDPNWPRKPITDQEKRFGNYAVGRYGWVLEDIRALEIPVPARGAQGLWDWGGVS